MTQTINSTLFMKKISTLPLLGAFIGLTLIPLHAETPATPAAPLPAASPASTTGASPASTPTLDLSDSRSYILLGFAWKASETNDYATVLAYTGKIIEMYQKQALDMQKSLTAPVPGDDKDKVNSMWALNDVGVSYFLRGQTFEKLNKTKEAIEAYKFLADNLAYAQCWDPKGWFWKPAGAAAERVKVMEFNAIK